jgi:hypothetical protein
MNNNKKIVSLKNQNDGIYKSIIAKNHEFKRIVITEDMTEDTIIQLLSEENAQLKEISNRLKPPKEVKEVKEDKEDEEIIKDPVKQVEQIMNLEEAKRYFFNGEYQQFIDNVKNNGLRLFKGVYNFSNYQDGSPKYAAKNRLNGFVRDFDDYRKYFIASFRCIEKSEKEYEYTSLWLVNTNENIDILVPGFSEDHTIVLFDGNIEDFTNELSVYKRSEEQPENLVGEVFLH